ncbi:MAG: hypothetical protein M3069_24870 [Chloroflexota bacterium]|nr:hypothetical protein [Chloroflexota bacterium]
MRVWVALARRPAFGPDLREQLANVGGADPRRVRNADQMIWPSQARQYVDAIRTRGFKPWSAPHALSAAFPKEFLTDVAAFLGGSGGAQAAAQ